MKTGYKRSLWHRGAGGDIAKFAPEFLKARLQGFEKDMRIYLTGRPSDDRAGLTHAYFPTLRTNKAHCPCVAGRGATGALPSWGARVRILHQGIRENPRLN